MSKPTLTPIKPLVLQTTLTPEGYIHSDIPAIDIFETVGQVTRRAVQHDLKVLHSLAPVFALLDEAVALDDSNVSPNATICKLREALGVYREVRS